MATYNDHEDAIRPVYESMKAAAAHMRVPIIALESAKKNGCPAFRFGRVYTVEWIRWLFTESKEQAAQDWADYEKKFKALIAEVNFHEKKKTVVDKGNAKEVITRLVLLFFQAMDRNESELPTALEGRDRLHIRKEIERINLALRDQLNDEARKI
jgi:hypothetical protein